MKTLRDAILSKQPVAGYTHEFYRYPARFSPSFARAVIENFTRPGDIILDPFMGSATTLVEARATGRHAIGTDINSLAVFIAEVKTTVLSSSDIKSIREWSKTVSEHLNLRNSSKLLSEQNRFYYQRNINSRSTWPIRKTVELALEYVDQLHAVRQRKFARCVLLRTAQWALDCRKEIPKASELRRQFHEYIEQMLTGAQEFALAVTDSEKNLGTSSISIQYQRSAIGIDDDPFFKRCDPPKLILTSPPYPGVHVLYHRWQVLGRKETPAPFWIAGSLDGQGAAFYTFGDRHQQDLSGYFQRTYEAFRSIAKICAPKTTIVQMLAFSDPASQLGQYLKVMNHAGLTEIKFSELANRPDGRVWREVPHRKWYASQLGSTGGSSEVVLFHKLS